MGIEMPSIVFGHVMHKRMFPKVNSFSYRIYNAMIPLSQIDRLPIALNSFALLSFYKRDHGACDGSDLEHWARGILRDYNITAANGEITLVCMPRVLGYVFNPVSFWLCRDKDGSLRAVLAEVHNTFGERHTYICAHGDHRPIARDDVLEGQKVFHVSPFLEREGHYTFRFESEGGKFGAWVNYFDAGGRQKLVTALTGNCMPMDKPALKKAFWAYPLVTFKAVFLIHWQALKLVAKRIKYIPRPAQKRERISTTKNLTKM